MAFGIVAFLVFGIGGWAATIPLEGAVVAQGSIVVDSNVKKVQHLSGGIVKEIRVEKGDHVKAGDILVRLDETQTKASNSVVTTNLDELVAQQARLEAERDGEIMSIFRPVCKKGPGPELRCCAHNDRRTEAF